MHLMIVDMVRRQGEIHIDNWEHDLETYVQSMVWPIGTTQDLVTGHTPGYVVFGQDIILPMHIQAN